MPVVVEVEGADACAWGLNGESMMHVHGILLGWSMVLHMLGLPWKEERLDIEHLLG